MRATLYRVGDDNVLAESLIEASRAGKDVAVLLEARARFDELQNLEWGLRFQNSGVRVLPLPSRKVHAKAIWVLRGRREFVHLGTGNYNTRNARLYTDFSLFTADPALTHDVKWFFDALEQGKPPRMTVLRTGTAIRRLLLDRIRAEAHPGGHVIFKFNHVTDTQILAALRNAARAGARVDLVARTTLTEVASGVHAKSLVGRFLEHARGAAFRNGGRWLVFAGSLDAMPRNFDRRYELFFPVKDPAARRLVHIAGERFFVFLQKDESRWKAKIDKNLSYGIVHKDLIHVLTAKLNSTLETRDSFDIIGYVVSNKESYAYFSYIVCWIEKYRPAPPGISRLVRS